MRAGDVLLVVCGLAAGAVCARLGFWQLSRAAEKRALHTAQRARLELPPLVMDSVLPATPPESGRRVRLRGGWERDRHVVLSGRTHVGAAGVSVVTAARLASGERVLVERGWLEAADSRTAHPERLADSAADVVGVALPFATPERASLWTPLPAERAGVELWSARTLDSAQAAARFPAPLASWMMRALPSASGVVRPGGESGPIAEPYELPVETGHVSYAIQWFAFALLAAVGSIALALRRRPMPAGRR